MRVFSIGFLVFLVFAIFSRWYFVCELRHHCGEEPVAPSRAMTLTLKDGDKTILQGYEQFSFPLNSFEPEMTPNNQEFLTKVAEYLKQFPEKNITLTGRYLESEKGAKSGIFENIGIARASAIGRLLGKMGLDEKRISIDYQMVKGDLLDEPVSFSLFTPKPEDYDRPSYTFTDNTFSDANFEFNSDAFRPGEQCIIYADSVKSYLDIHPEMLLSIIGHTDSVGTEKYNYDLGLRRAKNASKYFRELGVKAKINVSSKGKTQPVAPNSKPDGSDNPDGRQKNRRVNFKIEEKSLNE
jgi:outer membrane protein OmpA-like peptidoglycan-associated protein